MQPLILAEASSAWFTPGSVATGTLATLIVCNEVIGWWKKRKKDSATTKAGNPDVLKRTSQIDEEIHDSLATLRHASEACRAIVYLFHNGDQYFDGSPIQKMTCAYESVQGGIARILDDQKGIQTSIMSAFISRMWDDTPTINQTDSLNDAYCKTMLDELSVTHFACFPLHQSPQKIIGCVQVHWFTGNVHRSASSIQNPSKDKVESSDFSDWFKGKVEKAAFQIQKKLADRLMISGAHDL